MAIFDGVFIDSVSTGSVSSPASIVTPGYVVGQIYDGIFVENTTILSSSAPSSPDPDPTPTPTSSFSGTCADFLRTSVAFNSDYTVSVMSSSLSQYGFVGGCTASQAPFSMGTRSLMGLRTLAKAPYVVVSGRFKTTGTLFPLGTR